MPRVGMNPSRHRVSEYRPARVTVAVLTHIPHFSGYFRHRFDVLRLCLSSLLAHTTVPYDLMVFDNGSCQPVVDYLRALRDAGSVRYLLLSSENVGKIGAFQMLFQAAPGELIAYNDDDVFFLPGWLEAHLQILDTFPRVGMVSGVAIRVRQGDETGANQVFARQPEVEAVRGRLIPEAWEREFAENTGRDWEAYRRKTESMDDLVLRYHDVEAFAAANHFQFVAPREVLLEALPASWGGQLMGQMVELDREIDRAGYLRLSTRRRVIRMMGNVVDDATRALAKELNVPLVTEIDGKGGQRGGALRRVPGLRRLAQAMYDRLYWWLNA